MEEQCRTCGEWFPESEMFDTDYTTYNNAEDEKLGLTEMVCAGCYDECYGRCSKCGEARVSADLVKDSDDRWICGPQLIDCQAEEA